MKRFFPLFLCMTMLFSLIACGTQTPTPPDDTGNGTEDTPPAPPLPASPIELGTLNVELAIEDAEVEDLMALGRELGGLLKGALAAEAVTVGDVHVTFGTSPSATADALRDGNVHIAWLGARTYSGRADGITPVLGVEADEGSYLYAAPSDAGRALGSDPRWEDIAELSWGLQQEHSLCGFWYPALYLADKHDGRTTEDLESIAFFDSFDAALAAAERGEVDIVAANAPVTQDGFTLLAEFSPVFSGAVAVTNADETVAGEAFRQRLASAILSLCETEPARGLLQSCGQDVCHVVTDADFDALRRIGAMGY